MSAVADNNDMEAVMGESVEAIEYKAYALCTELAATASPGKRKVLQDQISEYYKVIFDAWTKLSETKESIEDACGVQNPSKRHKGEPDASVYVSNTPYLIATDCALHCFDAKCQGFSDTAGVSAIAVDPNTGGRSFRCRYCGINSHCHDYSCALDGSSQRMRRFDWAPNMLMPPCEICENRQRSNLASEHVDVLL